MTNKNMNICIWLQNGRLIKAISNPEDRTIMIYDQKDNLILRRKGLTKFQIKQIEVTILKYGTKKLDKHVESLKLL